MCRRGPCGGPFTGVSKLRLFLLRGQRGRRRGARAEQGWGLLPGSPLGAQQLCPGHAPARVPAAARLTPQTQPSRV